VCRVCRVHQESAWVSIDAKSRSHETALSPIYLEKERCSAIRYRSIEPLTQGPATAILYVIYRPRIPALRLHDTGFRTLIAVAMPGPFTSKSFSATLPNSLAARYRKALQKHPFLLFGLPFLSTILLGSFMLTPATALRYERYDRKNQQITQEQAMGLRGERRKVNMKDEYYVRIKDNMITWEICTDKCAEITGERSRGLGAEACQAVTGRARRHTCVIMLCTDRTASDTALRKAISKINSIPPHDTNNSTLFDERILHTETDIRPCLPEVTKAALTWILISRNIWGKQQSHSNITSSLWPIKCYRNKSVFG
jgi:cytochrome c oxidase assembly protein subunit 16